MSVYQPGPVMGNANVNMDDYLSDFGDEPIMATCPNCKQQAFTNTDRKIGFVNYLTSFLCCTNPW